MKAQEVLFVLPELVPLPSGGHKVIYEHAIRLVERGHRVKIAHFNTPYPLGKVFRQTPWNRWAEILLDPRRVWRRARHEFGHIPEPYRQRPTWFHLPDTVGIACVRPSQLDELIGSDDTRVVATAWNTARPVLNAQRGRKFYFIQDLETWEGCDAAETFRTWRMPLRKIVISQWLRDLAVLLGDDHAQVVPNAVDHGAFRILRKPQEREARSVLFYYSPQTSKDWPTTRETMVRISTNKLVRATLLAATRPAGELPSNVTLHVNPSKNKIVQIYNDHAIFVHCSLMEGWGLPPMEAMACGCTCVLTDSLGVRDFIDPALRQRLCRPGDVNALTEQIKELTETADRRTELALAGRESVIHFTWERSVERLEGALGE